jgi:predicted CoA-binding protein
MDENTLKKFLDKKNKIGFVGATVQKDKWGYKIYNEIKNAGFSVYPINPKYEEIDGDRCFPNLKNLIENLNEKPDYIITIVPPKITEKVVIECKNFGIDKIWMQPGSESKKAINFCKENKIEVISGFCIYVDAIQNF